MRLLFRSSAPLVALLLLGCAAGYSASCAQSVNPPPKLGKSLPAAPELPPPPSPPPQQPEPEPESAFAGSVEDARDQGCTTKVVEGLTMQIIAEANCVAQDSFARLPELPGVTLDPSVIPFLATPARDALVQAVRSAPSKKLKINSALRTVVQQYLLYDWYQRGRCGISLAAKPGNSNHEDGLAIDISEPGSWRRVLGKAGFRWFGRKDPWHYDYRHKGVNVREGWDVEAFQRLWNRNHSTDPIGEDGDYGTSTEKRLRRSPAAGFPVGAICKVADDEERPEPE